MFDDLHDTDPPTADMASLAAVSARAKAIRLRRRAIVGSLAAGVIAVVGVTVALTRDDDPGSIAIVDDPSTTVAPDVTTPDGTDPGTGITDPPSTSGEQPGVTDPVTTDPQVDCPAIGLRYVGSGVSAALIQDPSFGDTFTTDDLGPVHAERSVDVNEGGTVISVGRFFGDVVEPSDAITSGGQVQLPRSDAPTEVWIGVRSDDAGRAQCVRRSATYDLDLDLLEAQGERMVTAIDGNGDAVLLSYNGTPTVLYDGTDPDDPPPLEGESTAIDGVAVPFMADDAWVGVCCEPVAGSLVHVDPGAAESSASDAGFGHSPVLGPDDRYLATADYMGVQIRDLTTDERIVIDLSAEVFRQALRVVWLGSTTLAVQIASDATSTIVVYRIVDGEAFAATRTSVPVDGSGFEPAVELVGSGAVQGASSESAAVAWLWDRTQGALVAVPVADLPTGSFASELTIRQAPAPPDASVVSVVGDQIRWVDDQRRLWTAPVSEQYVPTQIPGEYIWVH